MTARGLHSAAVALILPDEQEVAALVPAPGSLVWRLSADPRLLAAAGYALLLQVSHPTVGAGVFEHSDFRADPWGRLLRTLDYVNGTIYGGPRLAAEIGRRVRGMHRSIQGVRPDGERYHALEPEAFAWVHATLAASILDGHRHFGRRVGPADRDAFWRGWLDVGRLIGVRPRDLPPDWAGFEAYFDEMVATRLQDTPSVHEVLETLARPAAPPVPLLPGPVWRAVRRPLGHELGKLTVGLLPPVLRARFGLRWTATDARVFAALAAASRASGPLLVGPLREFGPAYVRWRREALARGDVARGAPPDAADAPAAVG